MIHTLRLALIAVTIVLVFAASRSFSAATANDRAQITRLSKSGTAIFTVRNDGKLFSTKVEPEDAEVSRRELAVHGLRVTDDFGLPLPWRVVDGSLHFAWLRINERGEARSTIVVRSLSSLDSEDDRSGRKMIAPPAEAVMGRIGGMDFWWKMARTGLAENVTIDMFVEDRAMYTIIARHDDIKEEKQRFATWSCDLRDSDRSKRAESEVKRSDLAVPVPFHLVKSASQKLVIDADLHVHLLGNDGLVLVGRFKPTRANAADIILVRNDEAGTTTVLERVGDALLAVEFKPEKEGFANPFGDTVTSAETNAILALLR